MSVHNLRFVQSNPIPVRLDEFLSQRLPAELSLKNIDLPEISKSKIRRLIVAGAVSVNDRQIRLPAHLLKPKATIAVRLDTEKFSFEKQPEDIAFELTRERILFEDEVIIVVDKPANLPTEATMVASRDHLHAAVKRFLHTRDATRNDPYVGVHHRLDRETSGVILFSKTRAVNGAIHELFLSHSIAKEYEALVSKQANNIRKPNELFIVENHLDRISSKSAAGKWGAVSTGGDYAKTEFCILEELSRGYRIQAMPLTGRTHQIRVHLSGLGLPLFGDSLYGGPQTIAGSVPFPVPRVMLHAKKLTFTHPVTGIAVSIEAPLPEDFLACLDRLRQN